MGERRRGRELVPSDNGGDSIICVCDARIFGLHDNTILAAIPILIDGCGLSVIYEWVRLD